MAINWNLWDTLSSKQKAEHGPRIAAYMPNKETHADPDYTGDGEAPQVAKYTNAEWFDQIAIRHYKTCSNKGQVIINQNNNVEVEPLE